MPRLVGDRQRRLIKIQDESDGRYLILSTADPIKMGNDDRIRELVNSVFACCLLIVTLVIALVRWKRLEDNQATREPSSKLS